MEKTPAPERLPNQYRAEMFSVDWTHPMLRVRLADGLQGGRATPRNWAEAEQRRPGVLRLQLAEPAQTAGRWRLALPLAGPEQPGDPATAAARADVRGRPFFGISGLCPWMAGGPPVQREPEFASPLAEAGAMAAARWIGRLEDLDAITSQTFDARVLVSMTQPDTGRTRFALLVHEAGREIPVKELRPWLAAAAGPGDWIAIHSQGPYAIIGAGDWRLGGGGDPRRTERLGGALELDALHPGELVDWARLAGATVRASTFETGYEPANLLKGLLWPAPFSPRAWISKPVRTDDPPPWIELDLGIFRPVERIVLAWPAAAGWSGQFQPARAVLRASLNRRSDLESLQTVESPAGAWFVHQFKEPTLLRTLRVEVEPPADQPLDRRARLAAVQVWGVWDGK